MKYLFYCYVPVLLFYFLFGVLYLINVFKSGKKNFSLNVIDDIKISARNGSLISKILLVLNYVGVVLGFIVVVFMFLHIK